VFSLPLHPASQATGRLGPVGATNIGSVHVHAWIDRGKNRPPKL